MFDTTKEFIFSNKQESKEFAKKIAKNIRQNDILTFTGDLGSGKTFLCREIIRSLCGAKTNVTSPTFNLLQTYEYQDYLIYHFDLYRLKHKSELYELGIEDAFTNNICLIEWPSIAEELLPEGTIAFDIEILSQTRRKISIVHRCK